MSTDCPLKAHDWRLWGRNARYVEAECRACKTRQQIYFEQESPLHQLVRKRDVSAGKIHEVWHKFCNDFQQEGEWKYQGGEFIDAIEEWYELQPDAVKSRVKMTYVDDSMFSTSLLLMVENCTEDYYMGASCLFIGQNDNTIAQFFMYPSHKEALLQVLTATLAASKEIEARQEASEMKWQERMERQIRIELSKREGVE